jgi:hypothetical protein
MLLLALSTIAAQALTQSSPTDTARRAQAVPATDSIRLVRSARSAQSSFELFRRNRLPLGRSGSGPCEIRIGRYCYWRGDDDDDKPPPPEAQDIQARRDELLKGLDSAARLLAGDAWMSGQLVRYLVEADRIDDALQFATTDCHASASWCSALAGYAAQSGHRFAAADSAFTVALSSMDDAERCRWLDLAKLMDGELGRQFDRQDCASRQVLARRLFWLGAPLYSVSATDLLTEHLARVTRARIAEHAATVDGESWADDLNELMTRYGWPRWYSRSLPDFRLQQRPSITGHDAGVPYNYLPTLHALEHVGQATADDWKLDDPHALTGYAPSYARSMHDVPSQLARFRRGDSTLVVAAWDARRDTTLLGRSLDAALVLAREGEAGTIARQVDAKAVGHISVAGIVDSGVISLELLAKEDRRAARSRVGMAPRDTGRLALSDLLLYTSSETAPTELEAVRDSALASMVVPTSRVIGVFWETYGLQPRSEPIHFTLTVEEIDIGLLRRVSEKLRFADPTSALRIQWDEVPLQQNGIAGRGVRVDLSRLRSGRYRMQLSIAAGDGASVVASRDVTVK